jgi:hypothetical protein
MSEAETEEVVAAMIEVVVVGTAMIEAAAVTAKTEVATEMVAAAVTAKMAVVTETATAAVTAKMVVATETVMVVMGNAVADSNDGGNTGS